jgi:hypothetical protein
MLHFRSSCAVFTICLMMSTLAACGGGPGPDCSYRLQHTGFGTKAIGSPVQERVEAPAGCTWTYQGDVPWITVAPAPAPATAGSGDGAVTITVAANSGVRRVGSATIAFHRVIVDQAGTDGAGPCTFTVFPPEATIGSAGGLGAFVVVPSAADCGWYSEARTPDDDWIDNDYGYGLGTGAATYQVVPGTVFPSLPPPRTGRLAVYNSAGTLAVEHRITQNP